MPIGVKCQGCGRSFRAPDTLADKRIKCPQCSTVIRVGAAEGQSAGLGASGADSPQPISVTCACGKKIRAKAEMAGKRGKCPACGETVAIPMPQAAVLPAAADDLDELLGAETAEATLPPSTLKRSRKSALGLNTRWVISGSVGAVGIALALVLTMSFWPSKEHSEPAVPPVAVGTAPSEVGGAPPAQTTPPAPAESAAAPPQLSLPDALTEPPPWNDPNPPFDLAEYLAAPPAEDNAAPLYLDAFFEFDWPRMEVLVQDVSDEELRQRYLLSAERREDKLLLAEEGRRLEEAWEQDPESVDHAEVEAWLAHFDVGFEKLAAAQERPVCVFETVSHWHSKMPHVMAAHILGKVIRWRTRLDIERGNLERPLEDLDTLLRLSRDMRMNGNATAQLLSMALEDRCSELIQMILNAPGIQVTECDQLLALLAEHQEQAINAFLEWNRAEYILSRQALYDLQHRSGSFDPQAMGEIWVFESEPTSPMACIEIIASQWQLSPQVLERIEAQLRQVLRPGAWNGSELLSDEAYAREVAALNGVFASLLALGEEPGFRQTPNAEVEVVIAPAIEPLNETTFAMFLLPAQANMIWASRRSEARLRGTECLVALRRWRLEHTGPPPDLETLVRAAGMSEVPLDPYSNQPLHLGSIEGQTVIYSVGADGKDDGAEVEWDLAPDTLGDFIFRLEASSEEGGGRVRRFWPPRRPTSGSAGPAGDHPARRFPG